MSISTAISVDRVSRVVGYKIKKGVFGGGETPNLPMRIAVLGQGNSANEATYDETPFEFTDARAVGKKYGYGSMLHLIARILRPPSGNLLGGIVTEVYPQKAPTMSSPSIKMLDVTLGGANPTANTTHKVVIGGRDSVDGESYAFSVLATDDADGIKQRIVDSVNGVLGSPVTAAIESGGEISFTTKWNGLNTVDFDIRIDVGSNDAGVIYAVGTATDGTGTPEILDSLIAFGEKWNTIVINPYGEEVFDVLEQFNGVPDPDVPTGRYDPIVFKPFVALFGNKDNKAVDVTTITDAKARQDQVTNVLCPAPNTEAFVFEAAANMAVTTALITHNTPHLGNGGRSYPDMPIPLNSNIGEFASYSVRDQLAKKGSSTVTLENGKYTVQDFITTYHPDGEYPPKFRKVRDLAIDWNISFGWMIIMKRDILDKALVADDVPLRVDNVVSPKDAKQLAYSYILQKAAQALIIDPDFSQESVEVGVNASVPNRLDVKFRYKRSSTADIVSTDVEVDFAFSL